jgi:hypothetical protein
MMVDGLGVQTRGGGQGTKRKQKLRHSDKADSGTANQIADFLAVGRRFVYLAQIL